MISTAESPLSDRLNKEPGLLDYRAVNIRGGFIVPKPRKTSGNRALQAREPSRSRIHAHQFERRRMPFSCRAIATKRLPTLVYEA